jgi:hypothetical protein
MASQPRAISLISPPDYSTIEIPNVHIQVSPLIITQMTSIECTQSASNHIPTVGLNLLRHLDFEPRSWFLGRIHRVKYSGTQVLRSGFAPTGLHSCAQRKEHSLERYLSVAGVYKLLDDVPIKPRINPET